MRRGEGEEEEKEEEWIDGVWACRGSLPDALSLVVVKGHRARRVVWARWTSGAVGQDEDLRQGKSVWQIEVKAARGSAAATLPGAEFGYSGRRLEVVGAPVRLWQDVPPSGGCFCQGREGMALARTRHGRTAVSSLISAWRVQAVG